MNLQSQLAAKEVELSKAVIAKKVAERNLCKAEVEIGDLMERLSLYNTALPVVVFLSVILGMVMGLVVSNA